VLGKESIRTEVSEKSIKEQWDSILGTDGSIYIHSLDSIGLYDPYV